MNIVQQLAAEEKARVLGDRKIPEFQPGDTLRVNVKIKEGERERVQRHAEPQRGAHRVGVGAEVAGRGRAVQRVQARCGESL